jgi:hypothetical protein
LATLPFISKIRVGTWNLDDYVDCDLSYNFLFCCTISPLSVFICLTYDVSGILVTVKTPSQAALYKNVKRKKKKKKSNTRRQLPQ